MEKTEFFFEQIIKFRGYTLRVYGDNLLSITLTKDSCPILSFDFSTNLANPKNPRNRPWKSSKLICRDRQGSLCLDLFSKKLEKTVLRIPWNIINPIMDGLADSFISAPEGLINYFIISAPGDCGRDFFYSYETDIFPKGGGVRCGGHNFDSNNNISLWMLYQHPGEKYSPDNEKALVAEIISSCNRSISLKVKEHEKLIAKIEARENYVRSENDKKAFIFSDKNYYIIITEDGVQISRGVSTHYNYPGDFYERNISESKEYLAKEYWQLIPVVATADNEEAMKVLDSFMKNETSNSLSVLMSLRGYMKSKVCV